MSADPIDPGLNALSQRVIGCAMEVHRELGPGLLESIYEAALAIEFERCGLAYERQRRIPVVYKGHTLGEYRVDFWVEQALVLELKAVDRHEPVFEAQLLTYLRITNSRIGLLINFNNRLLKEGIRRFVR